MTQTWRERLSIVGKMINIAFNGDAKERRDVVRFTLVVVSPDRTLSIAGNMPKSLARHAFQELLRRWDMDAANDDEITGHA